MLEETVLWCLSSVCEIFRFSNGRFFHSTGSLGMSDWPVTICFGTWLWNVSRCQTSYDKLAVIKLTLHTQQLYLHNLLNLSIFHPANKLLENIIGFWTSIKLLTWVLCLQFLIYIHILGLLKDCVWFMLLTVMVCLKASFSFSIWRKGTGIASWKSYSCATTQQGVWEVNVPGTERLHPFRHLFILLEKQISQTELRVKKYFLRKLAKVGYKALLSFLFLTPLKF